MKFFIVLVFAIFPFILGDVVIEPAFDALNIFWFIISFIMFIYIYITQDKEHKSEYKEAYEYELPSDIHPELLGLLMTGEPRERYFIASVFELIRKNAIRIAITEDGKDYILVQNMKYNEELSKGEFYILKWLFHYLGNDYEVPLSKITEDSKRNSGFFSYCYHEWSNLIEVDSAQQNMFESKRNLFNDMLVYFLITYLLAAYNGLLLNNYVISISIGILNTAFIIYTNSFRKRTQEANLEYEKWKAFIRYVKTDNILHESDPDKLAKIMVYSKVLKLDSYFHNIYKKSRNQNGNQLLVAINKGITKDLDNALSKGIKFSKIATNVLFSKNKGNTSINRKRYNNNITFIYDIKD